MKYFKRMLFRLNIILNYIKIGWRVRGYDYSDIYTVLSVTLNNLEHSMLNGYACYETGEYKKLPKSIRICNKLLKRLSLDNYYYDRVYNRLTKQYGEIIAPRFSKNGLGYSLDNNKVNKAWDEFVLQSYIVEQVENRDKRNLFRIIEKYHQGWWD